MNRSRDRLSLAIEHLQNAVRYSQRGRAAFFAEDDPDTYRLLEGELRKALESLHRQGDSFVCSCGPGSRSSQSRPGPT